MRSETEGTKKAVIFTTAFFVFQHSNDGFYEKLRA